jgi:signal transduction histidine kinase
MMEVNGAEIKQAMERLEELLRAAKAFERANSEVLTAIGQEIRTPMNGVIGLTGLLLNTHLDPKQRYLAEKIRDAGKSIVTALNGITEFLEMGPGDVDLEDVRFDLRATVGETLDIFHGESREKGVAMRSEVDPALGSGVSGDRRRVRQLLSALTCCALQFAQPGELVLRAAIEADEGTTLVVRFEAGGTAIQLTDEKRGLLLETFARAGSPGLAICKRVVEAMGGSIAAESLPEKGTSLQMRVRLARGPGNGGAVSGSAQHDLRRLMEALEPAVKAAANRG